MFYLLLFNHILLFYCKQFDYLLLYTQGLRLFNISYQKADYIMYFLFRMEAIIKQIFILSLFISQVKLK